jgi:23S rRNA pseudouridine2605 synthase
MERLNKVLAHAGVTSRRGADALIQAGRVTVNGDLATEPGTQIQPDRDVVRLDGEIVSGTGRRIYLALYKPRHVVATLSDPEGRPTVADLVDAGTRCYPAGRLDFESEGLLILTNDGDLAHRLMHPRFAHEKEYRVKISGTPTEGALRAWREGMYLEDGKTLPTDVVVESGTGGGTWLRFVLREGRNRQVRRMIAAMHHTVHRLVRVRIGGVRLGDLAPGEHRALTPAEVAALEATGSAATDPSGTASPGEPAARPPRYKPGWARPKPPAHRPGGARRRPFPGPGSHRRPPRSGRRPDHP